MILYIETNFIIRAAKGRDQRAEDLLDVPPEKLTIALPDVCLMEAWIPFERAKARRPFANAGWEDAMKEIADDLAQDTVSPAAQMARTSITAVEASIKQAELDLDGWLNEFERRLLEFLRRIQHRCTLLPTTAVALSDFLTQPGMGRRRDSLILFSILEHARQHPHEERALLTNDDEFRFHVKPAGLTYFPDTENFLRYYDKHLVSP